jgi:hypothetical protein
VLFIGEKKKSHLFLCLCLVSRSNFGFGSFFNPVVDNNFLGASSVFGKKK